VSPGDQLPKNDPAHCIAAMRAGQEEFAAIIDGIFQDLETLCNVLVQRGVPAFLSLVAAQQPLSWSHPTSPKNTA